MRILHLDAGKEMRGGQWQVMRLIEGLTAAGVESTLLARPGAPLFEAAEKLNWKVEPLGLTRAVVLAQQHDLMHAHDASGHKLGAIVRGAPLVVSRRVAFPVGETTGSQWKYGRAVTYLAVSEFVKSVLIQGGVPDDKISVVYDGVPLLDTVKGSMVMALANGDDPQKGQDLAVEAARIGDVKLKLSTDLERDLADTAVFVYLTHSEGLGSAVLLAMSAGVPVVASKVGGVPEIISHGENGMLVDNEPAAIAAAIRQLLDDRGLARRIGSEARRSVMERFTVGRMVRRTMDVYRQVLK